MENGQKPITPIPDLNEDESGLIGLTKREYYAGLAMQGFISSGKHNSIPSDICKTSIKLADELLKQLEK